MPHLPGSKPGPPESLKTLWRSRDAAWIIPCPSSLWGRLRGRLDVAGNVAAAIAEQRGLRLAPAPHHLHWRLSKRARAASRTERASIASALPLRARDYLAVRWSQTYGPRLDEGQILLLDDVATTGQTLVETAQAIGAGASGIRPLLVALAASPKLRDHSLS